MGSLIKCVQELKTKFGNYYFTDIRITLNIFMLKFTQLSSSIFTPKATSLFVHPDLNPCCSQETMLFLFSKVRPLVFPYLLTYHECIQVFHSKGGTQIPYLLPFTIKVILFIASICNFPVTPQSKTFCTLNSQFKLLG